MLGLITMASKSNQDRVECLRKELDEKNKQLKKKDGTILNMQARLQQFKKKNKHLEDEIKCLNADVEECVKEKDEAIFALQARLQKEDLTRDVELLELLEKKLMEKNETILQMQVRLQVLENVHYSLHRQDQHQRVGLKQREDLKHDVEFLKKKIENLTEICIESRNELKEKDKTILEMQATGELWEQRYEDFKSILTYFAIGFSIPTLMSYVFGYW